MKYCKLLLLLTVCLFAACTKSGIEETTTKQEYIDKLEKLSDKARQKQLNKDIDYLANLLQSTQRLQVYNRNVSRKTDERTDLTEVVEPFALTNRDSIEFEFKNLSNAKVIQRYGIPNSVFDVRIQDSLRFVDQTHFIYQLDSAYLSGKGVDPLSVSLVRIDSLLANIDYEFVTSVDTLAIFASSKTDSIFYKKNRIDIVEQSDKSLKIVYPINLELVDYRAVALSDGLPMLYQTSSDFSIFSISIETESALKLLIDVLKSASEEKDKESALSKLNALSDNQFSYYVDLKNFKLLYDKEVLKHKDNSANKASEMPADFIKEYTSLLSPVSKELTLTFDKSYSRVMLYAASRHETIKKVLIAQPDTSYQYSFNIYKDRNSKRYGIIDKDAKIVIPAIYDFLSQDHDLYYRMPDPAVGEKQDLSYFLDTVQKILRPLPADIKFVKVLNANTSVFENSKGKQGVLSKNKVEIIPYRYDDIALYGKTIVAKGATSNDLFYEFYNISGKKINLPQIKSVRLIEGNPTVIIKAVDGKEGFINKEGVATIRPQYYGLKLINDSLLKYNTDPTYSEYSAKDYLWGIVGTDGEEITKPKYYSIGFFSEDMAPVYIKNGDILRGGYINAKGEVAIEPKYLFVNEFYQGYALIRTLDNYSLINKQGKVVKNFPKGTYVELVDDVDRSKASFYETSDGINYDYQGNVIK